MRKIFLILIILFVSIGAVYAGNNTTDVTTPHITPQNDDIYETAIALESGDSNITFSNNMTGYCVEYREHSATQNDTFYVTNTSKIVNKNNGSEVGNYLKTFFIKFHNDTLHNNLSHNGQPIDQTIFNQHIIWYFTNDFSSPITKNSTLLLENIKNEANNEFLGDNGYYDYDNGTRVFYQFRTLLASYDEYQNYFGYMLYFTQIPTEDNNTINDFNNTSNQTDTNIENITYNETIIQNNEIIDIIPMKSNHTYTSNNINTNNLTHYTTGNNIIILLIALGCLLALVCIRKI